jgi:hypothetical protein
VFGLMRLHDGSRGFGQILASYGMGGGHFFVGVFRSAYSHENVSVERITGEEFALVALTLDALLVHGHWGLVGQAEVDEGILRSRAYKIATAPGVYEVEDAFGTVTRLATARDVALLPFRTVVAPIRVQHAFEALHGHRDWLRDYDALRA